MAERPGLHRILELSTVYTAFQRGISRSDASDPMRLELYPELGSRPLRVLDIGCGPAAFYDRYRGIGNFSYKGLEPNRYCVEDARRRFSDIEVHAGTVPQERDSIGGPFDLIAREGVLHHIDDDSACEALGFASERLAPCGRVVALDPVILASQHPVARVLARLDRGKHVRSLDGYRELALAAFPPSSVSVRALSGQLRVPHDHSVLEAMAQ